MARESGIRFILTNRIVEMLSILLLLTATACSKRSDESGTSAVASSLSKRSIASLLNNRQDLVCYGFGVNNPTTKFPIRMDSYEAAQKQILQGLIKGGYLTSQTDMYGAVILDLSAKGREANVWNSSSGFCIGREEVDEVVNWSEPQMGITEVTYKMKVAGRPKWADEESFSAVPGVREPVERHMILQKMNDGWHAP